MQITFPFDNPLEYVFNSSKIEWSANQFQLKLANNPGQDFIENFEDDTGHVVDDTLEFSGGKLQQINQRPANAVLYNNFENIGMKVSPEDINFSDGTKTGALGNNATVHDGILDFSSGGYWEGNPDNLSSIGQQGCIIVRKRFGYTGNAPTIQYIIQTSINIASRVYLVHNSDLIQCYITDEGGVTIFSLAFVWTPTNASKFYEFAVNWNATTGQARLLIDGITQDTDTGTGTINAPTLFRIGAGVDQLGAIDQVLVYDTVQHTGNYTPDWSGIQDADFLEGYDTLPEMVYTGAGTLISLDALTSSIIGNLLIALQIGRSGVWTYWNGSEWGIGDGTKDYMCTLADFASNVETLDIEGEIYGQFRIYLPISYAQGYIDELTASLTAQIYPIDNPKLIANATFRSDQLLDLLQTTIESGNNVVKMNFIKDDTPIWYNSVSGEIEESDGTYAQSNIASELIAILPILSDTDATWGVQWYFHSEDGTVTSIIQESTITYDVAGPEKEDIHYTEIWFDSSEIIDEINDDLEVVVSFPNPKAFYKGTVLVVQKEVTLLPDLDGRYKIKLIDTDNMNLRSDGFSQYYELIVKQRTGIIKFTVPESVYESNLFENLV
jgi:hypothetical protein